MLQLKLLKRIATVKDNGTVEFEIPGDIESRVLGVESQSVHNEVEDEPLDAEELQYIPPIQIVMLIVGTRGDVQPFIAIGKRLQVLAIIMQSQILHLQAVNTLYMHYTYVLLNVKLVKNTCNSLRRVYFSLRLDFCIRDL